MTTTKKFIAVMGMTFLSFLAYAQSTAPRTSPQDANATPARTSPQQDANATPPRIKPTDAKNHAGETVTVCGNVVDIKVNKYGIAGHGKPVIFDLDQPEPNPVFYFVTFGEKPGGPQEAISAYKGKSVCVTGKIVLLASVPYIMADDRSKIKPQAEGSK